MAWKIEYFQTTRGDYPVLVFLDTLDFHTNVKVKSAIELLEINGPFIKPPYMKKLLPNLYELRIKSKVAVRVFYSPKTNVYYLLHAFVKKTQKTPIKELKIAIDRMKQLI